MKTKTYGPEAKIYFCPNCHREIKPPFDLKNNNIQGNLNLGCGYCGKGRVRIQGKKTEPDKTGE